MEGNSQIKKKKVLFLVEAFDKGGIEKVTLDIVNHLDPQRYDITVQTFWYGGHCQSLVNSNVCVIPFFFRRYVKGIIRLIECLSPQLLYRLFVHGDYDIEIAASDGGAAKVISGSNNKKAKRICWVHMDVANQGSKLKEYSSKETAAKIYTKFDKIVCVSDYARSQFLTKFGEQYQVECVHNPIPMDSIYKLAEERISEVFDSEKFHIVAVGSLMQVKGFDRLIRVCGGLSQRENLPVELYIVGSGPMKDELQAIIDEGLYSNVKLLGFKANPYPYIKKANLFVCSSYSEAYPLVLGESFILGTPVLGTRCSGVCEWMEKDQSGLIVENTEEALYAGIKQMMASKTVWEDFKNRAEKKSLSLNFKEAMDTWEKVFLS